MLKTAYEMVAVADYYRSPLPIEVLVSALGVDYREWLDAAGPGAAAWGILYSEKSLERDTFCYRPRNIIVTRLLVEAINGLGLHHTGEVAVLSKLLRACDGTLPVYQRFCTQILVSNKLLAQLDYSDGLHLFDAAINATSQTGQNATSPQGAVD